MVEREPPRLVQLRILELEDAPGLLRFLGDFLLDGSLKVRGREGLLLLRMLGMLLGRLFLVRGMLGMLLSEHR